MADKTAEIQYTAEELEEIKRIVSLVTGEDAPLPEPPAEESTEESGAVDEIPGTIEDIEDTQAIIPENLDLQDEIPGTDEIGDLDSLTGESLGSPGDMDIFSDEDGLSGFDEFDNVEELTEDIEPLDDIEPPADDSLENLIGTDEDTSGEEDIEDITGLIKDLDEPEEDIMPLDDGDLSFIDEEESVETTDSDISGIEEISDIDDLLSGEDELPQKSTDFSIGGGGDEDIPDLDQLSIDETQDIPEGDISDIPDIDLPDLAEDTGETDFEDTGLETEGESETSGFDDISDDLGTMGEIESFDENDFEDLGGLEDEIDTDSIASSQSIDEADEIEDMGTLPDIDLDSSMESDINGDMDDLPDIEMDSSLGDIMDDEPLTIEPLDDGGDIDILQDEEPLSEESETSMPVEGTGEIELTDKELSKLKKAIILFNPAVRNEIKDTVLNDRLSPADTRRLVDMILTGKPEDNIHRFLEKRLKKKIDLVDESKASKKRIITSRPEYTLEGRKRQKRLLKLTKIFGASALLTCIITIASYNYIYKPYMAKKLIHQGVEIIINSGLTGGKFQRRQKYDAAEKIFKEVNDEYKEDYIYGYNEYARAYLKNKDYKEALEKLNKAYRIEPTNKDTLSALGYFYAKTSKPYFNSIKRNLKDWYFKDSKEPVDIKSNLEMAINFYRRVLLLDKEDIGALVGIGNAYFYQGQYLKAKKYYEDILKVDKDSIPGYSGLMNLYIERDSMPMTVSLHAEIRQKKMLSELPSPLLSKLAGYYIDKNRTPDTNVRIDYGVTSPRFKDPQDKMYPAILEVLKALNERDPDYPQLQIQYARLSMDKQNYLVMERYLQKALELSPNYYSALHLLGKYYYMTKEPVKAYQYLKKAMDHYPNQPAFTRDEFYKETENIGGTNKYLGNIFYYYFDRVKDRKGGLDDEIAENETEKIANLAIAEQYYTMAANMGDNSSELNYNLGRIYYLKKNYTSSLNRWLQLYGDFIKSPELMLSLGNAFYHKGSYGAAKGELLKLVSVFEYEADKIKNPKNNRDSHIKVFQTLSSAYNNLGAVYQNLNEEQNRDLAYWKSVEFAKKIGRENEYARVNLARSHRNATPLLDESIPFSIEYYSEKMRWGKEE